VPVLDAITLSRLDPSSLLGLQLHFLDRVGARLCRPVLIIYSMAGRWISLGRYHLYGGPEHRDGLAAYRRLTGGRIYGAGEGWLGVALILPNRSALLREQDSRLKPGQVMNRYARGAMNGLRGIGLDCFYPGRDAITITRREIAMCSFETAANGAMLFELVLAVNRGMEDLVHDLERFDPEGALACAMYDRENSTKAVRELGRDIEIAELSESIVAGCGDTLGEVERRELAAAERSDSEGRAEALIGSGWLHDRRREAALDRVGRAGGQLGFIEAHLKLGAGGIVDRIMLSGDFIANSMGISRFESELAGKQLDLATVSAAAIGTFGDGSNYILGLGEIANLVGLVMKSGS
jgi:lipoate-protein ligase A